MPCFRSTHTTLQTVFCHGFRITVVVGNQLPTCQYIVSAQTHGVGFLAVGAFTFRLLLFGFPALSCYIGTTVV